MWEFPNICLNLNVYSYGGVIVILAELVALLFDIAKTRIKMIWIVTYRWMKFIKLSFLKRSIKSLELGAHV